MNNDEIFDLELKEKGPVALINFLGTNYDLLIWGDIHENIINARLTNC